MVQEIGNDLKTLNKAMILQKINYKIADIRMEERALKKQLEKLRQKRITLDRQYELIYEGKISEITSCVTCERKGGDNNLCEQCGRYFCNDHFISDHDLCICCAPFD